MRCLLLLISAITSRQFKKFTKDIFTNYSTYVFSLCGYVVNQTLLDEIQQENSTPGKLRADNVMSRLINSTYDHRVRPSVLTKEGKYAPVSIDVNIYLRSISNIDFVNMQYSVQLTFREQWLDPRLAYSYMASEVPDFIILTSKNKQELWMPDTFFPNEKQAHRHMIDVPNMLIRVHKDGTVLFSERISLTLSCPMHLEAYPMDVQTCYMDLASYAYTTDDLVYKWNAASPIQFHNALFDSLPSFVLSDVKTETCISSTSTGVYDCLRTLFHLRRQFGYYLIQVYIPSILLVIVSWVSFWLDKGAVPARVTLGVTTLLSMTTQAAAINQKLPPVSYVKAIDIWIAVCLSFIFGAVLEYAYVSFIASYEEVEKKCEMPHDASLPLSLSTPTYSHDSNLASAKERRPESIGLIGEKDRKASLRPRTWNPVKMYQSMIVGADSAKLIDVRSRFIFPLLFVLFNILYWLWYAQKL